MRSLATKVSGRRIRVKDSLALSHVLVESDYFEINVTGLRKGKWWDKVMTVSIENRCIVALFRQI